MSRRQTPLRAGLMAAVASLALPCGGALADDLYFGFTRLDPEERRETADAWLVVSDGRIRETGTGEPPAREYDARHDMTGLYALPGFIDAHGHVVAGPHSVEVVDGQPTLTMESVDEITRFHARMSLAFGVTTLRNPGGDPEAAARYDARLDAGEWIGPDTLHAGAVIQPPPFGGNAFAYPQTEAEWQAEAAREAALGMTYFKLYHGLTADELAMGIEAAHDHGLEAIAHLDQVSWSTAAELGIDGLLHALPTSADLLPEDARAEFEASRANASHMYRWYEMVDLDGPQITGLLDRLAAQEITVDLTLGVNAMLGEPDIDAVLPADFTPYVHPDTLAAMRQMVELGNTGRTEADFARAHEAMTTVYALARRMDEAGVVLLLGTDGNGGGPAFVREMGYYAEAGFSNWEILAMATSRNADGLGLAGETGRLAEGLEADIVFLAGNPVEDLARAGDIAWVVNNGTPYTFDTLAAPIETSDENGDTDHD